MGLVTDESGVDSPQGQRSLFRNDTSAVRASQPHNQLKSDGIKRPVREANQLLVSSVDVKN